MRIIGKICLSAALALSCIPPVFATPLTGACNGTLMADYIRAGGGNIWYIDCDAEGQLTLNGKTYQVFEYSTGGYGQISLGIMEPGFVPAAANFNHLLDAALIGAGQNFHAARLSDYDAFELTITKSGAEADCVKKPLLTVKLKGKCQNPYNDKGERISTALENCSGADWRLQIMPKTGSAL